MKSNNFRQQITDTLKAIGLYSENAVELLMGTCAQESHLGKYRRQLGGGPALGIFQMEPATFRDISENYLRYKPELREKILQAAGIEYFNAEELVDNDWMAICFARVHYLRVKEAIPCNLSGWAYYWKRYYNTRLGKGTEEEFIANYKKYNI